jgi:hypothetical protein
VPHGVSTVICKYGILTSKYYLCATHFPTTGSEILRKKYQSMAVTCSVPFPVSPFIYLVYSTTQSVTRTLLHLLWGLLVNNELKSVYSELPCPNCSVIRAQLDKVTHETTTSGACTPRFTVQGYSTSR